MTPRSANEPLVPAVANASGIYWAAVIAGAFITVALWLTLTMLGVGLGLSSISPWTGTGASSKTMEAGAIIWLIVSQIIASSLGGYLAGRWRIKWPTVHTTEVYFRDTAHGFLVWAVAVVVTAAFLSTALSAIVGSGVQSAPALAAVGPGAAAPGAVGTEPGAAGNLKAAPTPAPQAAPTPQELEKARKAMAKVSIWMFIALLIGAFCASLAATIGGRQRDNVVYVDPDTGVRRT